LPAAAGLLASCAQEPFALKAVPEVDEYCLQAQRVVSKTDLDVSLVVQDSFDGFVKSKAVITESGEPEIQQYNWLDDEGMVQGISCKLKSADHLNLVYGDGTAGPDGLCQDMNQAVFARVAGTVREPVYKQVVFDPAETVSNPEQPGMTGPDWLAPYTMTYVEGEVLHIASKGFVVDFTDPAYAKAPERFRGVHYCHLIAPEYLVALLSGEAPPGAVVGREVNPAASNPGPR
jgi:hypothetical protein